MQTEKIKIIYYIENEDTSKTIGSAVQKESKIPSCIRRENLVFYSSKGQMFVIAAILMLVAMIALKNLLGIYATFEEKRFSDAFTLDKDLRNMKNEYMYLVGLTSLQGNANLSGINYIYDFANFTASDAGAKVLYVYVFGNKTTQKYSVTVGNFIDDEINVTLNATYSTPAGFTFVLNTKANATYEFTSNTNGLVNVTLSYSYRSANITEKFPVAVTTAQNVVAGFFDITVSRSDQFVRSKSVYNRTW